MTTAVSPPAKKSTVSTKPRIRYDLSNADPRSSLHWKSLNFDHSDDGIHNHTKDTYDIVLHNLDELKERFQKEIKNMVEGRPCNKDDHDNFVDVEDAKTLALWSLICGYCEALATNKDENRRYNIFPIPLSGLRLIMTDEFLPFLKELNIEYTTTKSTTHIGGKGANADNGWDHHRKAVQAVANAVWSKAENKGSVRDEIHANSLYVCFRGKIDKRSLDCFGAAIVTIAGLNLLSFPSYLTLSEDHAYESHLVAKETDSNLKSDTKTAAKSENETNNQVDSITNWATCEIAIPGKTKDIQSKRGKDIAEIFKERKKNPLLTPETSWLYMRRNPIVCKSIGMAIAAVIGNINCTIETKNDQTIVSGQLYEMKRDLLWILYDAGYLREFPFGLIELGECEEHRPSLRGLEPVNEPSLGCEILMNEKLFLSAIQISRAKYMDSQTYPYFYAGHYHKDAGQEFDCGSGSQEYRLVEALRLYSGVTRVASQYTYDSKDSLELIRHITALAKLIMNDILEHKNRQNWIYAKNAIAASTWLLAFFDSLLLWEETCSNGNSFVEILNPNHKYSIGKMFQLFTHEIRLQMIQTIYKCGGGGAVTDETNNGSNNDKGKAITSTTATTATTALYDNRLFCPDDGTAQTNTKLLYFNQTRSKRLSTKDSSILLALGKAKVSIRENELAMPISVLDQNNDGVVQRRSKRTRSQK